MSRSPLGTIVAAALTLALFGCAPAPGTPGTPAASGSAAAGAPAASLVLWPDNAKIPHLFFHSLVVDPDRAFAKGLPAAKGIEQYMVTIGEFSKILQSLYDKGFILVHPQRIAARDASGVMKWTPLYLPAGKKPLILSMDDASYNKVTIGNGFADRFTLDAAGHVTNDYTDAAGKTVQGAYDVPTVLDAFVASHPDFSSQGDKGTIALTGYEGVLGYRSSPFVYGNNPTTQAEIAKAKAVADALKATGWNFASHSFGHRDYGKLALVDLGTDMGKWKSDVEPIIGATPIMIYAVGADIAGGNARYATSNPKFAYLNGTQGFDYFFNVDGRTPYWSQLGPTSLRANRINIDGIALSRAIDGRQQVLPLFFDAKAVVDPLRPLPTPGA
jgi:hypothetical protein